MSPVLTIQRRMMQLGRVRLGEKGPRGEPRKLATFRFTSASEQLLERIAAQYGGTVRPWTDAPDEGYFEVTTKAAEIEIILPPAFSEGDGHAVRYSQWYELWSGGGCQRRCDGETESFSGDPCLCAAAGQTGKDRACQITTRVSFMLPGSSVGVWRLDTHGYYAAVEAPAMLDFLRDAGAESFVPAVLRIENRTRKVGGKTLKFVVPVIDFPQVEVPAIEAGGELSLAINAPSAPTQRPALPAAPPTPDDPAFDGEESFGTPPPLPVEAKPEELTPEQFAAWVAANPIPKDRFKTIGAELFPDRKPNSLTPEELGQFKAALEEPPAQESFFEQAAEQAQKKKETAKA